MKAMTLLKELQFANSFGFLLVPISFSRVHPGLSFRTDDDIRGVAEYRFVSQEDGKTEPLIDSGPPYPPDLNGVLALLKCIPSSHKP